MGERMTTTQTQILRRMLEFYRDGSPAAPHHRKWQATVDCSAGLRISVGAIDAAAATSVVDELASAAEQAGLTVSRNIIDGAQVTIGVPPIHVKGGGLADSIKVTEQLALGVYANGDVALQTVGNGKTYEPSSCV